jgi:hypothetical protein
MLDLHVLWHQFRGQLQPDVWQLLAHRGEHFHAVLLELAAERVNVVLIDLIPRALLPASPVRITALALLPWPQIRERLRV